MGKRSYRVPLTEKWMTRLALLRNIGVSPGIEPDPDEFLSLKVTLWEDQLDRVPDGWKMGRFRHDYEAWNKFPPGRYGGMEYKVIRGNWTDSPRTTAVVKVRGFYFLFDEAGYEHTVYLGSFRVDSVDNSLPSPLPRGEGEQRRAVARAVDEVIGYEVDRWMEENPERHAEIVGARRKAPST